MKASHFSLLVAGAVLLPLEMPGAPGEGLAAKLEKRFHQLDKNGDGQLSVEEAKPAEAWLAGADANNDGQLSFEEARNHLRARLGNLVQAKKDGSEPAVSDKPEPMFEAPASPREEPRALKPGECGIGRLIPDLALTTLDGKARRLSDSTGSGPVVIALVSPSCPVSKRYLPTLGQLAAEYGKRGVGFLLIAPNPTDTPAQLEETLRSAGLSAPCLRDEKHELQLALGARATADVFVLDAARTLAYRGAIDDQYGLGYSLDAPRHHYLRPALDAVIAGESPRLAATEAPGCALDLEPKAVAQTELTYHNRISRLMQANCLECHRAGGVAPFALETYEQVVAKSGMIRKMVERGLMPPWFAAPPAPGTHTPWGNDRSLAEQDKADLLAWLGAGKPQGEAKDAPVARVFPKEWAIGQPDLVVQIPQPIEVKATGTMPYQNITVETGLTEDRWVRGLEVQPTAREVVHHVLVFVQEPGVVLPGGRARFTGEDDERGGFFAAYVPGNGHALLPEGFAKKLPAGAKLRFQIHYTPNGAATRDQVKLGLIFTDQTPKHIVRVAGIVDHRLSIPPGAPRHPESATLPVPADVKLLGFTPHMHVRGTAFRYEAILPDGTVRTLLDVPRYDFNWQISYRYAEPPTLPRGAAIRATGWFDNSANNPANPDPTKTVRWGAQTYDEMMLGYVEYYLVDEKVAPHTAAR